MSKNDFTPNLERIKHLVSNETDMKRDLGLFGAVSIIGGIMIGSGIFYIGAYVLQRSGNAPGFALTVWVIAGIVSLMAALCYAELGAAMPRAGGEYVYLREAYGPVVAFVQGWSALTMSFSASISALAVAFVNYLSGFFLMEPTTIKIVAALLIVFLTVTNLVGVKFGGMIQNIFMVGKLIPIVVLILLGLTMGHVSNGFSLSTHAGVLGPLSFALIAALWAYDGWNNVNIVAEEIKNPQKNLPLAMLIAVGGITVIYVLFNFALLKVLPLAQVASTDVKPGIAAAQVLMGKGGAAFVGAGICISIFGACNGCILAFPRVYYAMAKDGVFFKSFAKLHPTYRTPVAASIASSLIAILLIFTNTFDQLTNLVVFVAWVFYSLTIVAVFILRKKYPDIPRPYKVIGYPVFPILTLLVSVGILGYTFVEDPRTSIIGVVIALIGVPVYYFFKKRNSVSQ